MRTYLNWRTAVCLFHSALCLNLVAQPTAFTYQGRLNEGGTPAQGIYDLRFELFDSSTNGVSIGVVTNAAVAVSDGLFTVTLDLGAGVFDGSDRWLEIGAMTNGGGAFSILSPRQRITGAPYAATAQRVAGGLPITFSFTSDQTVSNPRFIGAANQSSTFDDTALPAPRNGVFSTVAFSIRQNLGPGPAPVSPGPGESVEVYVVCVPKAADETYGIPQVTTTSVEGAVLAYGSDGTPAPDSSIVPEGTAITLAAVLNSTNKHAVVSDGLAVPAVAGDLFAVMLKPDGFTSFKPALSVVLDTTP